MKDIKLNLSTKDRGYAFKFFKQINSNIIENNNEIVEVNLKIKDESKKELEIDEITNLIMEMIKDKLLKEYIEKEYSLIYQDDKKEIYMYSLEILKSKKLFIEDSIKQKLKMYIKSSEYINLDGFVNFRMKGFKKYIAMITDLAVEEYIAKKDQNEFINVLRYFIEAQGDKIDLIRVHIKDENTFLLYDKYGRRVNSIDDEEIINMVIKENLNSEDFLISTLLTLCPRNIEIIDTLKSNISKELIENIRLIFDERVSMVYQN